MTLANMLMLLNGVVLVIASLTLLVLLYVLRSDSLKERHGDKRTVLSFDSPLGRMAFFVGLVQSVIWLDIAYDFFFSSPELPVFGLAVRGVLRLIVLATMLYALIWYMAHKGSGNS